MRYTPLRSLPTPPLRLRRRRRLPYLALAIMLVLVAVVLDRATARAEEPDGDVARPVFSARTTRQVAERHFTGWRVEWVVRTAGCESSHDPDARNWGYDRRYGAFDYRGLMSVDKVLWGPLTRELHGADASLYDPDVNLAMAAVILERQGAGAWPYCSNGGPR